MNKVLKLLRENLKEIKSTISHSKMVVKIEGQSKHITDFHKIVLKQKEKYKQQVEKAIEILKEAEASKKPALNIADVGRSVVDLDIIAHLIANKAKMPYCWEDIKQRLETNKELPFKLKDD